MSQTVKRIKKEKDLRTSEELEVQSRNTSGPVSIHPVACSHSKRIEAFYKARALKVLYSDSCVALVCFGPVTDWGMVVVVVEEREGLGAI